VRWDAKGFGVYSGRQAGDPRPSRAAAHEWARDNIRVNVIAPFASTQALDYWFEVDPEAARKTVDAIPAGPHRRSERDIGRAVVFLVGPDASLCHRPHHAAGWRAGLFRMIAGWPCT